MPTKTAIALNIYGGRGASARVSVEFQQTVTLGRTVCPLVLLPTSTCLPLMSLTPTLIFLACKTACS